MKTYTINDFSGGLRDRPEPWKLLPNQSVDAANVDVMSGALKALKKLGSAVAGTSGNGVGSIFKDTEGNWVQSANKRSSVDWGPDKVIYSEDSSPARAMVIDEGVHVKLGVTGPNSSVTAAGAQALTIWCIVWREDTSDFDTWGDYNVPSCVNVTKINDETQPKMLIESNMPDLSDSFSNCDILYLGFDRACSGIFFDMAAPGSNFDVLWEYPTADAAGGDPDDHEGWVPLNITKDTTIGFTAGTGVQYVGWEIPEDWYCQVNQREACYGDGDDWPIWVVRCRFVPKGGQPGGSVQYGATTPWLKRCWPAMPGIQDSEREGQFAGAGKRRILVTWQSLDVSAGRNIETHPALGGYPHDYLAVDVDGGAISEIEVTNIPQPPAQDGATIKDVNGEYYKNKIKLWMTLLDDDAFRLVTTLDRGTTSYTITEGDSDIVDNDILDSGLDGAIDNNPPYTSVGPSSYPRFITYHAGRYWCAGSGDYAHILFWSKVNRPHYWPLENQYPSFRSQIQGIQSYGGDLIVFTARGPYRVIGSGIDSIAVYPIESAEVMDCVSAYGVAEEGGKLLFPSTQGIGQIDATGCSEILTDDIIPQAGAAAGVHCGVIWDRQLFLFIYDDALIGDFRGPAVKWFRLNDVYVRSVYVEPDTQDLYVGTTADYEQAGATAVRKWLGSGSYFDYIYKTGEIIGEAGTLKDRKLFDKIVLTGSGSVDVSLIVDGSTVVDAQSVTLTDRYVVFFPIKQLGLACQILLEGTATIEQISLNYDYEAAYRERLILHLARVNTSGAVANFKTYADGVLNITRQIAAAGLADAHFTANTFGYIPQVRWDSGDADVIDVEFITEPDTKWAETVLVEAVKFTTMGALALGAYVDGVSKRASIDVAAAGEYVLWMPPGSYGKLPQLQWRASVEGQAGYLPKLQWITSPLNKDKDKVIVHRARVRHSAGMTGQLYVDSVLKATLAMTGNDVSDIFPAANIRGQLAQLILSDSLDTVGLMTASSLHGFEIWSDPAPKFKDFIHNRAVWFSWSGDDIVVQFHKDGTKILEAEIDDEGNIIINETTIALNGRTEWIQPLPKGSRGYVFQMTYTQNVANSGRIERVEYQAPKLRMP